MNAHVKESGTLGDFLDNSSNPACLGNHQEAIYRTTFICFQSLKPQATHHHISSPSLKPPRLLQLIPKKQTTRHRQFHQPQAPIPTKSQTPNPTSPSPLLYPPTRLGVLMNLPAGQIATCSARLERTGTSSALADGIFRSSDEYIVGWEITSES